MMRNTRVTSLLFLVIILVSIALSLSSSYAGAASVIHNINVVKLGAKPDGRTDSTDSFNAAWVAACSSRGPALINVPKGKYLVKNVEFRGGSQYCKNTARITFRIQGTLLAPSNYNDLNKSENWVSFKEVQGLSIIGGGTLDAQGSPLWACKAANKNCPDGATSLRITNSKDIVIEGLRSVNSQMFNIVINRCENVKIRGVMISAPGDSPNTDGIHVQQSTGVTISNTGIKTGDDCISIGPGTKNLWIQYIACGPGHGISIGSLAKGMNEEGVQNVTVRRAVFTGTQNGLRIKAWGRPSNGFVKGVLFQHAIMKNVQNPIVIDQNYCPHNKNCPNQASGIRISDVRYEDIRGTSATQVAVKFDCSKKNPCDGIRMKDVKLTYKTRRAQSTCANVGGSAHGLRANLSHHCSLSSSISYVTGPLIWAHTTTVKKKKEQNSIQFFIPSLHAVKVPFFLAESETHWLSSR
ncbi:hypothetical protein Sjap_009583 [Stephania japonica]|uniref:Polygalacturonase n=1 Tax=Stephania japonica TaxID=461633 RepID=A0AAP0JS90_9MAGN